jgi:hypothetical protein
MAERISFVDALRWLRGAEEGEEMPAGLGGGTTLVSAKA